MGLEDAILSLVRAFVERQQVVFNVIQALRPGTFVIANRDIPGDKLIEIMRINHQVPQCGVWQNDEGTWDYFFHGMGCRLAHQVTGEVIDWDVPDVATFDPWKLLDWIKWAVETKPNYLIQEVVSLSRTATQEEGLELAVDSSLRTLTDQGVFVKALQGKLHFK